MSENIKECCDNCGSENVISKTYFDITPHGYYKGIVCKNCNRVIKQYYDGHVDVLQKGDSAKRVEIPNKVTTCYQIKIIQNDYYKSIEEVVNEWLKEQGDDIEIISLTHTTSGTYHNNHIITILFKEKGDKK